MAMSTKIFLIAGALVLSLSACGGGNKIPTSGILCDTTRESFLHYPELFATGVPDGNFPLIAGRVPAGTRVVLNVVNDTNPQDKIYGTTFGPVTANPTPSYPLGPGQSASDLQQAMVPALQPKTMYEWGLDPSPGPCAAAGTFTTL
jgi:hypothetical protein